MGLLKPRERQELIMLLLGVPHARLNPNVRQNLLIGQPIEVQVQIADSPVPLTHITNIVSGVDPEELEQPYPTGWPVLTLLNQAIFLSGPNHPGTPKLKELETRLQARATQWGLVSTALATLPPQEPESLERIIDSLVGFQKPAQWRAQMERCERAVCRVEFVVNGVNKPIGSGFLLGPRVVMTNYHVMRSVIDKRVAPHDVVLRFDYKEDAGGVAVPGGQTYQLAGDWRVADSPVNQLDFALVRLAEKAGEEMLPDQPTVPRGWLTPEEHEFVAGEPLFILQHPAGDPLRVAFDRVVRVPQGAQSTRITYRTNTKRGSSGSPCFTINWGLVALHHGFDEDDPEHPNEGIPFAAMLGQVQAALGT